MEQIEVALERDEALVVADALVKGQLRKLLDAIDTHSAAQTFGREDSLHIIWEARQALGPMPVETVPAKIAITQPIGNCDGSGRFAYDPTLEDGRGEPLPEPCPGCRACR